MTGGAIWFYTKMLWATFPLMFFLWQRFCWQSVNDVRAPTKHSNFPSGIIWHKCFFGGVVFTGRYNVGLYSSSPKGMPVCVSVIVMALRGHASEWHERCQPTCNTAGLEEIVWKARRKCGNWMTKNVSAYSSMETWVHRPVIFLPYEFNDGLWQDSPSGGLQQYCSGSTIHCLLSNYTKI